MGKPCLATRATSATPAQRSWCATSGASKLLAAARALGLMHRTKWSCDESRRDKRARSCNLNAATTVALLLLLLLLLPVDFYPPGAALAASEAISFSKGSVEHSESSARASADTTSLFFDRKPSVL